MTTGYFSSPGSMLPLVVPMTMETAGRPATEAAPGQGTLAAVVKIAAEIPSTGRTAEALGTYREGCGVVIDDGGLILTVGYLIVEAKAVAVRARDDAMVPATIRLSTAVMDSHNCGIWKERQTPIRLMRRGEKPTTLSP